MCGLRCRMLLLVLGLAEGPDAILLCHRRDLSMAFLDLQPASLRASAKDERLSIAFVMLFSP